MPQDSTTHLDALRGSTALVTGGTGFIGQHLIARLRDLGVHVAATTRRSPKNASPRDLSPHVDWHRLDLRDEQAVEHYYESVAPDFVFHLASHVAGSRDLSLVAPTFHDNLASTVNLLLAAARHGCRRFLHVGSLEEPDDDQPTPVPSSPYAAAKAAASAYCRMFHQLYATPVVLARVFMVYGPGPQDENKLVPYVIRRLLADQGTELSSGQRPVDWIVVDDVVEGFVRMAAVPGLEGQRVDLGTGELHTVAQMVEEIYRQLAPDQTPSFGARQDRQQEQIRRADVVTTEQQLGWRPSTSLVDGVGRTIAWFSN